MRASTSTRESAKGDDTRRLNDISRRPELKWDDGPEGPGAGRVRLGAQDRLEAGRAEARARSRPGDLAAAIAAPGTATPSALRIVPDSETFAGSASQPVTGGSPTPGVCPPPVTARALMHAMPKAEVAGGMTDTS